jgi:predicted nucleotidyltransferase
LLLNPTITPTTQPPWTVTPEKLSEARRRLIEVARPQKIIVFGSHARGDAGEESDVDFLVVEAKVEHPAMESVRLRRALKDLLLPVDLLVVSQAKFDYWRKTPGTVYFEADQEGRVIYEAP